MREIKFRAWDLDEKCWVSLRIRTQLVLRLSGRVTEGSTNPNVILLQYTGLKDKSGKEIYEGHIIEDVQGIGVVGFSPPCFTVQCRYNMHYFLGAGNMYPENYQLKTTKIIGNIYENPELLK